MKTEGMVKLRKIFAQSRLGGDSDDLFDQKTILISRMMNGFQVVIMKDGKTMIPTYYENFDKIEEMLRTHFGVPQKKESSSDVKEK